MIRQKIVNSKSLHMVQRGTLLLVLAAFPAAMAAGEAPAVTQKGFDSPQGAVDALVKAAGACDLPALRELFGPEGNDLIESGDPVQDKNNIAAFAARAQEKNTVSVDRDRSSRAILSVGADAWPFPVPIVNRKGKWYFATAAGRQEILYRRIGANELDSIQICRGFAEAQWEYASAVHDSSGTRQFAQKIISSPGKQDGLYWASESGSPGSPIGETVARAIDEGYAANVRSGYHGYYFKVLKGQGASAPLGELDYVIEGLMIGGFALIATPVEYGVTGVKTFMVGPEGIVYEKDFGADSLKTVKNIERYDPDKTWHRPQDEWPGEGH